jgi:hypothetical protein
MFHHVPASNQTAVSDTYLLLYVQFWTPDDGRKDRPKHVECYPKNKINLRICCILLDLLQKYIAIHGPMNVKSHPLHLAPRFIMCKPIWLPSAEPSSNNTACPQPVKPAMNWPYGRQQSAQMVHASGSSFVSYSWQPGCFAPPGRSTFFIACCDALFWWQFLNVNRLGIITITKCFFLLRSKGRSDHGNAMKTSTALS